MLCGTQKADVFQRFSPTFQKLFLKSDLFDSFNGLRYWRWAGVDSAWEQKKLEARKMPINRAESPASSARFVGRG